MNFSLLYKTKHLSFLPILTCIFLLSIRPSLSTAQPSVFDNQKQVEKKIFAFPPSIAQQPTTSENQNQIEKVLSAPPLDYVIGPNDILSITFYDHSELSSEALVLPDGTISYSLIGSVYIKGQTLSEVTETLRNEFLKYYKDPIISVSLSQFQEQKTKISIIGEVRYPGKYSYVEENRLSEYLADAGGLTDAASSECIVLRMENGKYQKPIRINLQAIFDEGNISEDIIILSDDTIYMPKMPAAGMRLKTWGDWWHITTAISAVVTIIYTVKRF